MRPQYHLRSSERGLLAWDIRKLIAKASELPPVEIPIESIQELDEAYWFDLEGDSPTCRKIAEHARIIEEAELSWPIVIDHDGRVMDGMHRVCKAMNKGLRTILAYRLSEVPEPDFIGVAPDELPYDESP